MQNVGDYHDFYLKTDVYLLTDVFENFRSICLKQYGLDLANHYTSPGLSWDVILKKTGVQLELLTDVDMHLFIEKRDPGQDLDGEQAVCKSQQSVCERFRPHQTEQLHPIS